MMKFVAKLTKEYNLPTTVSLNPIMIDGTGMCGCCRVLVGTETKFACVEGPEFDGHLVDFDLLMKRQAMYKKEEHECNLKLGWWIYINVFGKSLSINLDKELLNKLF